MNDDDLPLKSDDDDRCQACGLPLSLARHTELKSWSSQSSRFNKKVHYRCDKAKETKEAEDQ